MHKKTPFEINLYKIFLLFLNNETVVQFLRDIRNVYKHE